MDRFPNLEVAAGTSPAAFRVSRVKVDEQLLAERFEAWQGGLTLGPRGERDVARLVIISDPTWRMDANATP